MANIRVVDDQCVAGLRLVEFLREHGHRTKLTIQSLRAFDHLKGDVLKGDLDLVIMDQVMPFLNGIDQIRLMSLDDDLRRVPVILMHFKDLPKGELEALQRNLPIVGFFNISNPLETLLLIIEEALKRDASKVDCTDRNS